MSYQPEQIQEATKNCKVLRGRGGDVNAEAVANNPNCKKNKKTAQKYTSKEKKAIVAFGLGAITSSRN